jgi:Baseplate J-like protein
MANIPGTNVPGVTFGANGFLIPQASAVLSGVQADIAAAFGTTLNFNLNTPQGQLSSSMAAITFNTFSVFQYFTQQVDPAYASGRFQDAIGRIYFMTRIGAQPTTLQVQCSGLGAVVPQGALVQDAAQNLYACTTQGTIPASGSITLTFACTVPGPVAVPQGALTIYQAIPGWDTATVASGVQGRPTESRQAFETRRQQSVASNSSGAVPSVLGTVLAVPGVTDAYATENVLGTTQTIGGVTLAAHSLFVCVAGTAAAAAIAQAIWSKKAPGCNYNGGTTFTVQDTSQPNPPFPQYPVSWQTAIALPVLFAVNIVSSPQVPSNAAQLIQNAVISAFNGTAQATFVGSINGTVLTVTQMISGIISVGQSVVGGGVLNGTIIAGALTGSGGIGTYSVNASQTVAAQNLAAGPAVTPRARIGALLLASNFFAAVSSLGSWAAIRSLLIGSTNDSGAAQFAGYITGTTLTVTEVVSGTIAIGQTIASDALGLVAQGTTITAGSGLSWTVSVSQTVADATFTGTGSGTNLTASAVTGTIVPGMYVTGTGVPANTTIVSQTSGTPGGAGVYVTSNATTSSGASLIGAESMSSVAPAQNSTQVNINQTPTIAAANIAVTVS